MECVRSVTYSILVNGVPKGHIIPSRGIWQGDPLSPYLFLLCSKGLNGLIQHAVDGGQIEGFSLCRSGPKISHLFFADDSLLFCRARVEDVVAIQAILSRYEKASGQMINATKTTLFFSKNVSDFTKETLKNLLGVAEIKEYEKYLGLPAVVGRKKKASLHYIKDRVWGKLQGWKEKLLSQTGKEVLSKAIVQAIPTFAMSCFHLLPDSLVWPAEKNGLFSVKPEYKCLCDVLGAGTSVADPAGVQKSLWKGVWKLKVPGKIKHFLWKSCTNSLPTKENLAKKTIISENICHLCSEHPEDVLHALWGCSKVQQVWQRSFGWLDNNDVAAGSFFDLVLLVQSKPRLFLLFAVTAWAVWHHRNKSRLQAATIPLNHIAVFAENFLQNFTEGHGQKLPPERRAASVVKCRPPSENVVKINFDGAIFGESDCAGLGVVIRNSEGHVLASGGPL
ncbi:uncharacterized protein LOC142640206 [Castanea sativa]|uniref:uncharacterized protein LOC142640206 n=1 Tax=Castanea sativa TaxID=21020 RepID=UPI003F64B440